MLFYHPYAPGFVAAMRRGEPDALGRAPERAVSDGEGKPCRSCLKEIAEGEEMLILSACPFPVPQPYAEVGPIFLCAEPCTPWPGGGVPPVLQTSPDYLLKGYSPDHRIVYGTGHVTARDEVAAYAEDLLADTRIAFVDVRSARNNCFLCRITAEPSVASAPVPA